MPDFNLNSPNLMASNWCNSMMISLSRSLFDCVDPIFISDFQYGVVELLIENIGTTSKLVVGAVTVQPRLQIIDTQHRSNKRQGRRTVSKSMGAGSNLVGIICSLVEIGLSYVSAKN